MRFSGPAPRARWRWAGVIALLALYWGMAVTSAPRIGLTGDEPVHLAGGYAYWEFNDYRMQPENGTLAMRIAALPLLAMHLNWVPLNFRGWLVSDTNLVGHAFLFDRGNPREQMLLAARAMIALVGAFTVWLIWRWASRLFGPAAGWTALALAVFSPTLLAHGGLATSDMAITAALLLAVSASWRLLHAATWGRLALAALALGAALLAKMSGVLVFPMLVMLVVCRAMGPTPLIVKLGCTPRWLRRRNHIALAALALSVVAGAGSLIVLWGGYGFRYRAFAPRYADNARFYFSWPQILDEEPLPVVTPKSTSVLEHPLPAPQPTLVTRAIGWANDHELLPEAYLWGFAHTYKFSRRRPAFLDGEYSVTGWTRYFPLSFWYKTTLPTLLLLGGGIAALMAMRRNRRTAAIAYRAAPLLALLAVYGAVALQMKLNIGHRHILPIYPVVFIFAGAAALWLSHRHRRLLGTALLMAVATQAGESWSVRPFYLSYFQPLAGGTSNGWRHLVDSSYDWGQGLPDLSRWLARTTTERGHEPVYLTYFGADSPAAYHLPVTRFADEVNDYGSRSYPVRPTGGWFAISATHFTRVYLRLAGSWSDAEEKKYQALALALSDRSRANQQFPTPAALLGATIDYETLEFGRLCHYLGHRQPEQVIGGSILLFHLTANEVAFALTAPLAEIDRANPAAQGQ